jgi:phosphatidylinositol-3-phosphatase
VRTRLAAVLAAAALVPGAVAACASAGPAGAPATRQQPTLAPATRAPATRAPATAPGPQAAGARSARRPCGRLAKPPTYRHVIWVWLENHSYRAIVGSPHAPYLNSLAARCGLATNYHNISHPSLPNYLAATSGLGYAALPTSDCDPSACGTSARSIFGQGETWRAYQESMPSACHRRSTGEYAVRHNPPPYYRRLRRCAAHDVPYSRLAGDLAHQRLPAFTFITPNLIDDMHDGTVAQGDAWLARQLPRILASAPYRANSTAVFITWDEGRGGSTNRCATNTTDAGCHVATLVISPSTPAGARSTALFNHYSLLGTAEQLLRLPRLGQAAKVTTMTSAFHL